jgi:hypothetical protein
MAPNNRKYEDWKCGTCKTKEGKFFNNFGFRVECLNCGCKQPKGARKLREAQGRPGGEPPELKKGGEAQKMAKMEKELASSKKRVEQLEKERASRKLSAAAGESATSEGMEVEEEDNESGVKSQMSKLRKKVKELSDMSTEVQELVGAEALIADLQVQIQGLQAGLRESRPLQQRVSEQTKFLQKLENAESQARTKLGKAEQAMEELHERMQVQQAAVDEAAAAAECARGELARIKASLAKQMVLEAGGVPAGAEEAPGGGQAPSGFIAIAEAERIHSEVVAKMREEYEQAVASTNTKDGDASEVAQSDIGDLIDVEDDEGWQKMEKGKRKTMLERSGKIVANKVKKLSKGATASSPFARAKAAEAAKSAEADK